MKNLLTGLLCAAMLAAALCVPAHAASGALYVNGEPFGGSFQQAVEAAMPGGVVEIEGRVYTRPVGWTNIVVADVTIQGRGAGAALALEPFYFGDYSSKCDVLTIQGDGVTVKNLTINAGLRVDFPLRVFGSDILIEDVTCVGGLRGAVNVLGMRTGKTQTYRNVRANGSLQGGFYFDDDWDCAGLVLEGCSTDGNLRAGALVRNSYGAVAGLDLSGITCNEGVWAIEDRVAGAIGGGERAEIAILAGPKGIDNSKARYIPFIENESYRHYRFGVPEGQLRGAVLEEAVDYYGFDTVLMSSNLPEGLLGAVGDFASYAMFSLWQLMKIWPPAVYF